MVEVETVAAAPFKLHPTPISYINRVFEHLHLLWISIWLHTHTVTTTDLSSKIGWVMQVCKPCHCTLFEAVEPFKLHPKSISYINNVFEQLHLLWLAPSSVVNGHMAAHSHYHHHRCFPRFGRIG